MKFSLKSLQASTKEVKFSKFTVYTMVGAGLLLVVWAFLTFFTSADTKKGSGNKSIADGAKVCPDCGMPLSKSAQMSGVCPYCTINNGGVPKKKVESGVLTSPIIPIVLGSIFGILATINVVVIVRSRMNANPEEVFYHINCRKCDRKVRYRDRQINQFARCPACKTLMRFPEPPPQPTRWQRVKSWLTPQKKKKTV